MTQSELAMKRNVITTKESAGVTAANRAAAAAYIFAMTSEQATSGDFMIRPVSATATSGAVPLSRARRIRAVACA